MGLRDRLRKLEEANREQAIERVRAFWHALSVEECALLCAWAKADEAGEEPPPGAAEVAEREREATNEVLKAAIGWREGMLDEDIDARVERLMAGVDPFDGRANAVRRRYLELMGGNFA